MNHSSHNSQQSSLLLDSLCTQILNNLCERKQSMVTAESCTGGLLASTFTRIPQCSLAYRGGVVAYANEIKTMLLGVCPSIIASQGAVSEGVVQAMAEGARANLAADWALATSGIAGPSGGSLDKPVGSVWMSIASPLGTHNYFQHFSGNRVQIQYACVHYLYEQFLLLLNKTYTT